ncbi:MAG: SBBP repeat-containing protein [Deltaproteobacteria bacterium]|nr:SBBP repeat-containing protein [Deltaproteobacteria bacterium]
MKYIFIIIFLSLSLNFSLSACLNYDFCIRDTDCISCQECINGACTAVILGQDPKNDCPGATACDGASRCFTLAAGLFCNHDYECDSGQCDLDENICWEPKQTGEECKIDNDCKSKNCAHHGICCPTVCKRGCESCESGTCEAIADGEDLYDFCPGVAACDGNGQCWALSAKANCEADYQCASTHCKDYNCYAASIGEACHEDFECLSNHCGEEGICCQEACTGSCNSCNNKYTCLTMGMCAPIPKDTDPFNLCDSLLTCDGNGMCQPEWNGVLQFGGILYDGFGGLVADNSGFIYGVGATNSILGYNYKGGMDAFIALFDFSGNNRWTNQFGATNDDYAARVDLDDNGNIYVCGWTSGDSLEGQSISGASDVFLRKYNSNHQLQWTRVFGSVAEDRCHNLVVDDAGNAYLCGSADNALPGNQSSGGSDAFIAKYDTNGDRQWITQFGTVYADVAMDIDTDGSYLYITGATNGSLFSTNQGGSDLFWVVYDLFGQTQLIKNQSGSAADDYGWTLSLDNKGAIYIAGSTKGSVDAEINQGATDILLQKYLIDGSWQWTRQYGDAGAQEAFDVVYHYGNVYLTGTGYSLVLFSEQGEFMWSQNANPTVGHISYAIAVDAADNICIGGYTFGTLGKNSFGFVDAVLIKYNTSGDLL